ncbi:hypothetical protein A499_23877 [Niallia nealsonii AAU1]|nr:hypothetical protein A499_23877 [Niallia nealsonii AAU1]
MLTSMDPTRVKIDTITIVFKITFSDFFVLSKNIKTTSVHLCTFIIKQYDRIFNLLYYSLKDYLESFEPSICPLQEFFPVPLELVHIFAPFQLFLLLYYLTLYNSHQSFLLITQSYFEQQLPAFL